MHNDQNLIECSIIILVCKVWFAFYCFPQFDLTIIPTTHLFLRVASYEYFLTPHKFFMPLATNSNYLHL